MTALLRNLLEGAGSILDLYGNQSATYIENDAAALRSDWEKVGQDMWVAVGDWEDEQEDKTEQLRLELTSKK